MNSWRPSKSRLAAGCEKISALISLRTVPAPPCMSLNCSGLLKSTLGCVIRWTRLRYLALRSERGVEALAEIGSASGRVGVGQYVYISVVAVSLKKNTKTDETTTSLFKPSELK